MKRTLFISIASMLILLMAAVVYAEEGAFSGSTSVRFEASDVDGSEAKYNEYSDKKAKIFTGMKLSYDSDSTFIKFKASDILLDTQSYNLDAGRYGKYKFNLFYNGIPHNINDGAISFYNGIGGNNLTFSSPISTPSSTATPPSFGNWTTAGQVNTFDYYVNRSQYGGSVKVDITKPFYIDLSMTREDRKGLLPVAAARSTSPGGGMIELPSPINYVTDTFKVEAGYATKPIMASLSYYYSQFSNDVPDEKLYFLQTGTVASNSAAVGLADYYTLAPDNRYSKIAFKGRASLPLNTYFNVNLSQSTAKSAAGILNWYNNQGTITSTGTLSDPYFNGDVTTTNYAFVLTSTPISNVDAKIYYKYYNKDNESDQITATGDTAHVNHLFDYKKNMFGVEVGIKLPAKFTLTPFYKYTKVERHREDIPETKDNVYGIDLKWAGLDFMTAKVGYERLDRKALTVTLYDDPTAAAFYGLPFDGAPQSRDTYKASVDVHPTDALSIGLEYANKKSKYKDSLWGITGEKSDWFNVNADYAIGKTANVGGYLSFETIKQDQTSAPRVSATDNQPNPAQQWYLAQRDKSTDYGVYADFNVVPNKLKLKLSYDNVKSNGTADLTYVALPTGYNQDSVDILNWDDYRKQAFTVKAVYKATKELSLTVGYAYEKFTYNDAAVDGYVTYPMANTFLTGTYGSPSYRANVVFASAVYKF